MPKKTVSIKAADAPPLSLIDNPFFGLKLDGDQQKFRDAIWSKDNLITFCNARAGTGKTTIAVATAILLVKYGRYNGITYIVSPYGEIRQGYLPGTITEKSEIYFEALHQALVTCGEDPDRVVINNSMANQKTGVGYVTPLTHTYLRGSNIEHNVVIIDEAQNFNEDDLRKTLTRTCADTKVIVIGHTGQIDLPNKRSSGFERCMIHFSEKQDKDFSFCELMTNYRSKVANVADEAW